ncbi:unnamed protein product, partial [Symbiodinium natans]
DTLNHELENEYDKLYPQERKLTSFIQWGERRYIFTYAAHDYESFRSIVARVVKMRQALSQR